MVKNAADKKQVKRAGGKEDYKRRRELNDLASILQDQQVRRFLWRLICECKTFESIWRCSAEIHYLAGRQDLGHFLMSEIEEADQNALFKMMQEEKEEKEKDNV